MGQELTVDTDKEPPTNGAFYVKPTLTTAIARAMGFRRSVVMRDEEDDVWPGHLATDITIQLHFLDRLRVLITGRISVHTRHRIDQPVEVCQSRSEVSVY